MSDQSVITPVQNDHRYYTKSEIISDYVPYTGANAHVDLGSKNFITTGTIGSGLHTINNNGVKACAMRMNNASDNCRFVQYTGAGATGARMWGVGIEASRNFTENGNSFIWSRQTQAKILDCDAAGSVILMTLETNGDVTMTGDLTGVDDLTLAGSIFHTGDLDTHIDFNPNTIGMTVGGNNLIRVESAAVSIGDNAGGHVFRVAQATGQVSFHGNATVFKDINIGAATLSGPPGLQPGIVNFLDEVGGDTGIATYGLSVGEGFSGEFEMQHDYKEGSDIVFHIHWQGIAAPTGTDKVQFQLSYTFGVSEATLDAVTTITIEQDFDTQYKFNRTSFVAITATDINMEDQFLFTLQRIAASADEYGGEALIATVGVHYEVDTVGSNTIDIK